MAQVPELIDRGVKAYSHGRFEEAEACWREALEIDPANGRARAYLKQLRERSAAAEAGGAAPVEEARGAAPVAKARGAAAAAKARGAAPAPAAEARGAAPAEEARGAAAPDEGGTDEFAPSPWDQGPAGTATVMLDAEGGLDLAAIADKSDLRPLVPDPGKPASPVQERIRSDVDVWMEGARELFALGDFSGSLEMIEKILKAEPEHAEAWEYLRQNEATLIAMYESKLGSLSSVPRLAIKPEEVMWLNLDHRAGFLLAQIDGMVNYEDLFALSGLPRLDTAKILATLLADGVIK